MRKTRFLINFVPKATIVLLDGMDFMEWVIFVKQSDSQEQNNIKARIITQPSKLIFFRKRW